MSTDAIVIALDPGPEQTAFVEFDGEKPIAFGIFSNAAMLSRLTTSKATHFACEGIACYGMPVGRETFETCIWIGRFWQAFGSCNLVYRSEVKSHLCRSMKAKDPMIRQALLDRFGPGKEKAIGTKKAKGPLYGVSSHVWSALAVAVTFQDCRLGATP